MGELCRLPYHLHFNLVGTSPLTFVSLMVMYICWMLTFLYIENKAQNKMINHFTTTEIILLFVLHFADHDNLYFMHCILCSDISIYFFGYYRQVYQRGAMWPCKEISKSLVKLHILFLRSWHSFNLNFSKNC